MSLDPAIDLKIQAQQEEIDTLLDRLNDREFALASTQEELARGEQLLNGWRATVQSLERELADGEARLVEAELQAERLKAALVAIRSGRAYRLMRVLWRISRPFKRR